mmetsp:Transcript_9075/g.23732  ORF Transcript_9075/g.23732 Transcript_9075/m.23732 type:complete len:254 (+) Transcript_9075:323-1084(+)
MLVLCRIAPLDIDERWVGLYDADVAQVAQREEVLLLAGAVDPAAAEGECVKILVDEREELLCLRQPQRDVSHIEVLHVMRALEVLLHIALARRPKRLDGEDLTLLHACGFAALDDRDGLARVDLVRSDRVPVQVADRLDWVRLAVDLNLIRLHHLLASSADVAQPGIDARGRDTGARGLTHRLGERVELRVEVHGPRRVDDASIDVSPEIDLAHIAVLQHRLVTGVRGPVRRHMVDGASGGKRDAGLEAILLH